MNCARASLNYRSTDRYDAVAGTDAGTALERTTERRRTDANLMTRRSKSRKARSWTARRGWWSSLDAERRKRLVRGVSVVVGASVLLVAGVFGLQRLDTHVIQLARQGSAATVEFVDLPATLDSFARPDLLEAVHILSERDWIDDGVCRELAERIAAVGWVVDVRYVRRTSDARFLVSCDYRLPVGMVPWDESYYLVDREGTRLPGTYLYDPVWRLIEGVAVPPPPAGAAWDSEALRAGLAISERLAREPFSSQIAAVVVENYNGRLDPRRSHIELATDRAGGRIRWGSAPGFELEENTVFGKLAILRGNFDRSGRVDEDHRVIDVSTFPDRYTTPG